MPVVECRKGSIEYNAMNNEAAASPPFCVHLTCIYHFVWLRSI